MSTENPNHIKKKLFTNIPCHLKKKRNRKKGLIWTIEEEYLLFESHLILGNKWKEYSSIIHSKLLILYNIFRSPKELKNHFHTCIIKTVRRIITKKFDNNLKDIIRSFYGFNYLKDMLHRYPNLDGESSNYNLKKLNRKNYKFNPKLLIRNKQLSFEIISLYCRQLTNYLLKKEGIKNFLIFINYEKEFNTNFLPWLFSIIIKSKLVSNLKKLLDDNNIKINEIESIKEFLEDNSYFIYFNEVFFKDC